MESVAGGSQATANVTSQSLEQTVCGVSPFSCFFFVGGFFLSLLKMGSLILDTHLAFIGTSFTTNAIYSHLQCVPGQKRTNRKKKEHNRIVGTKCRTSAQGSKYGTLFADANFVTHLIVNQKDFFFYNIGSISISLASGVGAVVL